MRLAAAALTCASVTGCGGPSCPAADVGAARDFTTSPAILDQPTFTRLLALSDIHGGYDRMVQLLMRAGLLAAVPSSPTAVEWSGGDVTLVVIGDLIDKGTQSIEVIELLRALEVSAATRGGHVIVTLGNHEAEFLADPYNSSADAFDSELTANGLDPCVIATTDERGTWLRSRPFGARVGDWFFAHAGQTHRRTVAELETVLQAGLIANDFRDREITGADSLLEARDWWTTPAGIAKDNADALSVAHIVFGHTPDALGPRGAIATGENGLLFRVDVGMSPAVDDSAGALLQISRDGSGEVATEVRADGVRRELWRGPSL